MDTYIELNGPWSSCVSLYVQKNRDLKTGYPITRHYINISSPHCCGGHLMSSTAYITLEEAEKLLKVLPDIISTLKEKIKH